MSTLRSDLHLCAHLLDSPQVSFHLSLLFPTPSNSCCLTSPQFHVSNFPSPVEVTQVQTFLFSPAALPFHSIDPFDPLKLRSAYLKETLPSGQLSLCDSPFSLCDTIIVSAFACLTIIVSCTIIQYHSILLDSHLMWVQRSSTLEPLHFSSTCARDVTSHGMLAAQPRQTPQRQRSVKSAGEQHYVGFEQTCRHERKQNSCTLPAEYLTPRSRLCRFRTDMPLKHWYMSVSRTAALSPLNT